MKKNFSLYAIVWALGLGLFNLITFLVPDFGNKFSFGFWFGYGFITICFIGQMVCAFFALRASSAQKMFYRISLVTTSYSGLILSLIVGIACMIIPMAYWVGVIACAIVLVLNVVAVVKAVAAVSAVESIDKKIKVQTFFIKSLTIDAETLMNSAKTEELQAECRKVYEAVRYSDPMSDSALASEEGAISAAFASLSESVAAEDLVVVQEKTNSLLVLIKNRNSKCRLLK